MKTRAAVAVEAGKPLEIMEVDLDGPRAGEVLVEIMATGICHTDEITRHGDLPMPFPAVLGHEGAGVVEAVGEGVTSVALGDHVVIGWPSCGSCRRCREGEPRYCARLGEALCGGGRLLGPEAGRPALRRESGEPVHSHFFGQSSFATRALVWADALVVVPQEAPLELLGPLACGVATGAGAVLHTRRFGATHTIDATTTDSVATVHDVCGGPADHALECTGVLSVVRQAADSVGMLGTCVLVGGAPAGAELTLDHLPPLWGKRVVGVLGGGGRSQVLIPALVELHAQGRFPFDELVETFELAEIEVAMAAALSGEVLKPVLRMPTS